MLTKTEKIAQIKNLSKEINEKEVQILALKNELADNIESELSVGETYKNAPGGDAFVVTGIFMASSSQVASAYASSILASAKRCLADPKFHPSSKAIIGKDVDFIQNALDNFDNLIELTELEARGVKPIVIYSPEKYLLKLNKKK